MKKRNALLAGAMAIVLGSGAVFAGSKYKDHGGHHGMHPEHRLEHMLEKMDRHLDLSEEQRETIKTIIGSKQGEMRQSRVDRMEMRLKIMQLDPMSTQFDSEVNTVATELAEAVKEKTRLYGDMVKQVATVLTPEQRQEAREMIEKRMDKMSKRMEKHNS